MPASSKSLRGDCLRNFRKQVDFTMTLGATQLSEPNQSNQPKEPEFPENTGGRLLSLDEGTIFASRRLLQIKFEKSKSQMNTKADGNCFLYGILDQLSYDPLLKRLFPDGIKQHYQLRSMVVGFLDENIDDGHILWNGER